MRAVSLQRVKYLKTNTLILICFLSVVLVQPFLWKVFGKGGLPFVNGIDDLFFSALIIVYVYKLPDLLKLKGYILVLKSFSLYLMLGIISALLYNETKFVGQILLQVFLDCKVLIFLSVFFLYKPSLETFKKVDLVFKGILILNIPFCILQLMSPQLYKAWFDSAAIEGLFYFGSISLPRCVGVFWHAGQLAFFCGIVAFYFLYLKDNKLYAILAINEMFLSLQRQEIAAFLFLYFFVLIYYKKQYSAKGLIFIFLLISILSLFIYSHEIFYFFIYISEIINWEILLNSEDARTVFYVYGFVLASLNFPLGVGFGNFAGYSAQAFKSTLYQKMHFDNYWWYQNDIYLTDTYYPHIIAEAGYLGFVAYTVFLFALWKVASNQLKNNSIKGAVFYCYLFIILVSLTSPALNEVSSIVLVGYLSSYCFQLKSVKVKSLKF